MGSSTGSRWSTGTSFGGKEGSLSGWGERGHAWVGKRVEEEKSGPLKEKDSTQ